MPIPWAVSVAISVGLNLIGSLFGRRRRKPPRELITLAGAPAQRRLPVIYGEARVQGQLVYRASSNARQYLWLVYDLSHGPVQDIDEIYLDGNLAVLDDGTLRAAAATVNVTSASVATPALITAAGHNLQTGDTVRLSGITGSTPTLNGDWPVTVLSTGTFTIPVPCTVAGTGGTLLRLTPGYSGYVAFAKYLGSDTQNTTAAAGAADGPTGDSTITLSSLTSACPEWTTSHRGRGVAFLVLRLLYNQALFQGEPTVECVVRGRTLFDSRSSTTAYSTTPSLVIRDYLTNTRYGWALPTASVDDSASFGGTNTEANYDEESVDVPAGTGMKTITGQATLTSTYVLTAAGHALVTNDRVWVRNHSGVLPALSSAVTVVNVLSTATIVLNATVTTTGTGGTIQKITTQTRFTINGVVDCSRTLLENIEDLLGARRADMTHTGGVVRQFARRVQSPATFTLTEDNIVDFEYTVPGSGEFINQINGTFVNAARGHQVDGFTWPLSTATNTYLTNDNNVPLSRDLPLPFTQNRYMAEQLAMVELEEARQQIWCRIVAKDAGLALAVGDVVSVTHSDPAWSAKSFWVMGLNVLPDAHVALALMEYEATAYDNRFTDDEDTALDTQLPSPWVIEPPTNLQALTGTRDPRMRISWTAAADARVAAYECQAKRTAPTDLADAQYRPLPLVGSDTTEVRLEPVLPNESYDVRVRSLAQSGMPSAWVSTTHTVSLSPEAGFSLTVSVGTSYATYRVDFDTDCDMVQFFSATSASSGIASANPQESAASLVHTMRRPSSAIGMVDFTTTAGQYRKTLVVGRTRDGLRGTDSGINEVQVTATASVPGVVASLTASVVGSDYVVATWSNGTVTNAFTRLYVNELIVHVVASGIATCTITGLTSTTGLQLDADHFRDGVKSARFGNVGTTTASLAAAATSFAVTSCVETVVGPKTFVTRTMTWAGGGGGAWEIKESGSNKIGTGTVIASGTSGTSTDVERQNTVTGNWYYYHRYTSPVSDWATLTGHPLTWSSC